MYIGNAFFFDASSPIFHTKMTKNTDENEGFEKYIVSKTLRLKWWLVKMAASERGDPSVINCLFQSAFLGVLQGKIVEIV